MAINALTQRRTGVLGGTAAPIRVNALAGQGGLPSIPGIMPYQPTGTAAGAPKVGPAPAIPGTSPYKPDVGPLPSPAYDFSQMRLPEFQNYQSSPEYQYRLAESQKQLNRQLLSKGRANSTFGVNALGRQASEIAGEEVDKQYQRNLTAQLENYQRATGENQVGYGRGMEQNVLGYNRGLNLNEQQYARGQTGYNQAVDANALDYNRQYQLGERDFNRGLTLNEQQYGRGQTAYGQQLGQNELVYGRGRSEEQQAYDRARYGEERDYGRGVYADERDYGRQFQQGQTDWERAYQLADLGYRATTQGVNAGNQTARSLADLLSQNGAHQASAAILNGQVDAATISTLLNSGVDFQRINQMFGGGSTPGYQTPPYAQSPNISGGQLSQGQVPSWAQAQGPYSFFGA